MLAGITTIGWKEHLKQLQLLGTVWMGAQVASKRESAPHLGVTLTCLCRLVLARSMGRGR